MLDRILVSTSVWVNMCSSDRLPKLVDELSPQRDEQPIVFPAVVELGEYSDFANHFLWCLSLSLFEGFNQMGSEDFQVMRERLSRITVIRQPLNGSQFSERRKIRRRSSPHDI